MQMTYVYLLESVSFPAACRAYRRSADTTQIAQRRPVPHTAKFRPWRLITYIAFSDERKAVAFEGYLKTGSGRPFR
jgi:hypothetical protein